MRSTGLSDSEITAAGGGIIVHDHRDAGHRPVDPVQQRPRAAGPAGSIGHHDHRGEDRLPPDPRRRSPTCGCSARLRTSRACRGPRDVLAAQIEVPAGDFGRRGDYIDAVGAWCADAAAIGADSMDVGTCEDGRFTEDEGRWIAQRGRPRRTAAPAARLRAAPGGTGAARVAAEMGCASADLLHNATDEDVAALSAAAASSRCLCPAVRRPHRSAARRSVRCSTRASQWSRSVSDHTPGNVGITSMPLVIALAVSYLRHDGHRGAASGDPGWRVRPARPHRGRWSAAASPTSSCGTPTTRAPSPGTTASAPPRLARRRAPVTL